MKKCLGIVSSAILLAAPISRAQHANSVVSYNAGTNAASGFNIPASALGEPSRFTEHQFGGPVDPFSPAFLNSQIVSIGAGGSLVLQMAGPVRNDASHPYGVDFIIYGNAGFEFGDFTAGTANGNFFGASNPGSTRVSVSADGSQFFTLDSSLAPVVDRYFPTDGAGTFGRPVDPSLANPASFAGKNLAAIRALYNGSAGGAGYDLAWARDASGNPVTLSQINYVRVDVLSGAAEIDGITAVPEPTTWALFSLGLGAVLLRKRRA